jgi:hypothetical protein
VLGIVVPDAVLPIVVLIATSVTMFGTHLKIQSKEQVVQRSVEDNVQKLFIVTEWFQ